MISPQWEPVKSMRHVVNAFCPHVHEFEENERRIRHETASLCRKCVLGSLSTSGMHRSLKSFPEPRVLMVTRTGSGRYMLYRVTRRCEPWMSCTFRGMYANRTRYATCTWHECSSHALRHSLCIRWGFVYAAVSAPFSCCLDDLQST